LSGAAGQRAHRMVRLALRFLPERSGMLS
jgi:hypothetical protein